LGKYLLAVPIVMIVIDILFMLLDEDTGSFVGDILNPGFAIPAALLAFALYWTTKKTSSPEIDLGLVIVFFLLALGELTYSIYVEILGQDPSVSLADLFWLLAYFVLALLLFKVARATGAMKSKKVALVVLAFWLLVSPVLVYVFQQSLQSTDLSALEIITWNLYTIMDAIILSLLITLIWAFRQGLLEDVWTMVAVAFVFQTVGDLLFTIYDAAGAYRVGSLPDVFYIGSYVLLTFGFGLVLVSRTRSTTVAPTRITFDEVDEARLLVPRATYVVWETESRKAYEMMVKGLTAGLEVMIVSAKAPTSIRPTFGLRHTEMYWLTTSAGDNVIHPDNTGVLVDTITRFMQKGSKTLVLLDGFELIKTFGDFRKAMSVIEQLEEVVLTTSSRLVVPINKRTLSEKEIALLEEYTVVIQ
jgi:hypothetical protein